MLKKQKTIMWHVTDLKPFQHIHHFSLIWFLLSILASIQIATSYHPLTPTLNVYICVLNSMMFYLMSRVSMGLVDPLWMEMKYLPYSGLMLSLTALPAGETTAPRHANFYLGIRTARMCSKHANS